MILLVNGPNLNLLGEREPEVYGRETLADVERMVSDACAAYGLEVKAFQSNWEGAILDFLQEHRHEAEGVIVNPGAFAQTSRALHDCLKALSCPTVEVHISNVHAREAWRRESVIAPATAGQIVGLGVAGYYYAALHLCSLALEAREASSAHAQASGAHGAEPSVGAEHGKFAYTRDQGRGEAAPPAQQPPASTATAPAPQQPRAGANPRFPSVAAYDGNGPSPEEIPVDINARGDYEPL
jgi:3-dehydroquinate dehydratase-2